MVFKIKFDDKVYDYLKSTRSTQVLRSRVFRLNVKSDQVDYQYMIANFKKWVSYYKPYTFNGSNVNELFFDFERMLHEYSMHYGIKSGEEIINEGALKPSSTKATKSIEAFIEESLKGLEQHIEKTSDHKIQLLISEIRSSWRKSFLINCVPNALHGNYVNIPEVFVSTEQVDDSSVSFKTDEEYFFGFLGRLPIKINTIKIGSDVFYNMVNTSIVPLFINTDYEYVFEKAV